MAQEDQHLLRAVIRSIDKRLDWEAVSKDGGLRVTLRLPLGEAHVELDRAQLDAALEGGVARNQLRERLKRGRKRILDSRPPYMPWRLPKIEPIGAPGPRSSWGGGRR
jgi:hypothetical protein